MTFNNTACVTGPRRQNIAMIPSPNSGGGEITTMNHGRGPKRFHAPPKAKRLKRKRAEKFTYFSLVLGHLDVCLLL